MFAVEGRNTSFTLKRIAQYIQEKQTEVYKKKKGKITSIIYKTAGTKKKNYRNKGLNICKNKLKPVVKEKQAAYNKLLNNGIQENKEVYIQKDIEQNT